MNIFRREPVLTGAAAQAIVALTSAFGLNLTGEQVAAIITVVTLVVSMVARSKVTPTTKG